MLFQSSKLKARKECCQSSKLTAREKRRSSFELWAFENVTPSGIGCNNVSMSSEIWLFYKFSVCDIFYTVTFIPLTCIFNYYYSIFGFVIQSCCQSPSMRMGFFNRGPSFGQDLNIYRGVSKLYRGLLYVRWSLTKLFCTFWTYSFLFFQVDIRGPFGHPRKKRKE